jgi:L,D-transpeptidase YcbB
MCDLRKQNYNLLLCALSVLIVFGCNSKPSKDKVIATSKSELNEVVTTQLEQVLLKALDSTSSKDAGLYMPAMIHYFYNSQQFAPVFTDKQKLTPAGNIAVDFINNGMRYGLFPKAYHANEIKKAFDSLSAAKGLDGLAWAQLEMQIADGFLRALKHIKYGRLIADSTKFKVDEAAYDKLYATAIKTLQKSDSTQWVAYVKTLEPDYYEYDSLKIALRNFLKSNSIDRSYTYVPFPYTDSLAFVKKLLTRLVEEGSLNSMPSRVDSATFASIVSTYQRGKGYTANGKPDKQMMAQLNATPYQKFLKVALNLDRFKLLPEKRPETFVLVNLPAFTMRTWDGDTIAVDSRVIVGKKETRTPLIKSEIYNFVTNPYWSIPGSIIKKETLPALKRNPGYLARRNMKLIDRRGRIVNPYSINWGRYSSGIPFTVRQDYGTSNSLGVLKFNFKNVHDVYLHDTNQRYLFGSSYRALSHGCVRVQQYESLAKFIARKQKVFVKEFETEVTDSITPKGDTIKLKNTYLRDSALVHADSIPGMIRKKWHREVQLSQKIPIYLDYFTATGRNGELVLHDDIYGEDRMALEKYGNNFK